jgi:hypothetical protein
MVDPKVIDRFLDGQPLMALRPKPDVPWRIVGQFRFAAEHPGFDLIEDSYELEIIIPETFPQQPPLVTETAEKIPRDKTFHIFEDTDTCCLGSPLALAIRLKKDPSLTGFSESCIIPYLYGVSHKLKHGGKFPFGELNHGYTGQFEDYGALLGLESERQILAAFRLLGMKKRVANKMPCPCGCGTRLGKCSLNKVIRPLRIQVGCPWFRKYLAEFAEFQRLLKELESKAAEKEKPAA